MVDKSNIQMSLSEIAFHLSHDAIGTKVTALNMKLQQASYHLNNIKQGQYAIESTQVQLAAMNLVECIRELNERLEILERFHMKQKD